FGEFDKIGIKLHPNPFFVSLYDCPSPSRKVSHSNMPLFYLQPPMRNHRAFFCIHTARRKNNAIMTGISNDCTALHLSFDESCFLYLRIRVRHVGHSLLEALLQSYEKRKKTLDCLVTGRKPIFVKDTKVFEILVHDRQR
ncbi:MAG: hypothetical protein IKJ77_04630, partial [Firmicutes bacterium]|nr:hypothetical protein [Bacillota bacterium]